MKSNHRRTRAEIDLKALVHNFKTLRKLVPGDAFFCPMVKANAYGHGAIEVARTLESQGVERLGVALIEEGIQLREAGIRVPILVFGLFDSDSVDAFFNYKLTPVLSDWSALDALKTRSQSIDVHLEFNTGMNRLGFEVSDAVKLNAWFSLNPQVKLEGVATHLFRGEDAGIPQGDTEAQFVKFEEVVSAFQGRKFFVHALNSSGAATLQERRLRSLELGNSVDKKFGFRPGIALYGAVPSSNETISLKLEPLLSFKSQIILTHRIKPGEKVSYSGTWQASRESLIGVIPLGYADGFPRVYSNNAEVLCRGQRVPAIGTVCMDYFMVDLTDVARSQDDVLVGEEVVLIGSQGDERISAEELARRGKTISYEVFTRISERVPRVYIR